MLYDKSLLHVIHLTHLYFITVSRSFEEPKATLFLRNTSIVIGESERERFVGGQRLDRRRPLESSSAANSPISGKTDILLALASRDVHSGGSPWYKWATVFLRLPWYCRLGFSALSSSLSDWVSSSLFLPTTSVTTNWKAGDPRGISLPSNLSFGLVALSKMSSKLPLALILHKTVQLKSRALLRQCLILMCLNTG